MIITEYAASNTDFSITRNTDKEQGIRREITLSKLEDYVITIPDFPKEGIMFRDVTGILVHPDGLKIATDELIKCLENVEFDAIASVEARGFVFGAPVAYAMGKPLIMIRKRGKLPRETVTKEYQLEYGTATIEIHKDDLKPGQRIVLLDDLMATAGTFKAAIELMESMGASVVKVLCLMELKGLKGREVLKDYEVESLIQYEGK